jgi:hypothetical protein
MKQLRADIDELISDEYIELKVSEFESMAREQGVDVVVQHRNPLQRQGGSEDDDDDDSQPDENGEKMAQGLSIIDSDFRNSRAKESIESPQISKFKPAMLG